MKQRLVRFHAGQNADVIISDWLLRGWLVKIYSEHPDLKGTGWILFEKDK